MAGGTATTTSQSAGPSHGSTGAGPRITGEPAWVRWLFLAITLSFLALFLLVPLTAVFVEALRKGVSVYFESFREPAALAAIKLTVIVAAISLPLNLVFGLAAAWCIAKFDFKGKSFHTSRWITTTPAAAIPRS